MVALFSGIVSLHSAIQASGEYPISRTPQGYYHYATEAVLAGQWHLSIVPRPELAELADPYSPAQNLPYRAIDLSYYNGRYYFYWGLAPVVLLFAPVYLLTGFYLSEAIAAAVFGWVAVVVMAALFLVFRRRYAPAAGVVFTSLGLLLLMLGSYLLMLASHNTVYGVPIASAAAGQVVAWWCIHRALLQPRRALLWTVGAGAALGCGLASRPNIVLWGLIYALPLWILCRHERGRGAQLLLAAIVPPALCVAAMLYANWARFGSIAEFGMRYQLTGPEQPEVLFSLRDVVRNLGLYVWNAPRLSRYFPFVTTPAGGAFGLLNTLPAVFLVFGLWCWRRKTTPFTVGGTIALAGAGGALATCAFFGSGGRYMADYLPGCVLAAALGGLALTQWAYERRQRWVPAGVLVLFAVSNAMALGLHLQNWDLLGRDLTTIARILNAPTFLWERMVSPPRGAVSLTMEFPRGRAGAFEPLLSVGSAEDGGEIVFITYDNDQQVRLGFFQTGTTHWLSAPIKVDYDQPQNLFISMGSLMPPASHPLYRSWSKTDREVNQREVIVGLNGVLIYRAGLDFRAGRKVSAAIGENKVGSGVSERDFTGTLQDVRWHPIEPGLVHQVLPAAQPEAEYGRWRLRVSFPSGASNTVRDPLLVSGVPGAGDFVYAFYPQPGYVAFGHDAWSHGGSSSTALPIDLEQEQVIEISHGGLYWPRDAAEWQRFSPERRDELKHTLRIWLNGTLVAEFRDYTWDASPESVTPLENRIGGSSTSPRFSGTIIAAERVVEPQPEQ